MSQLPGNSISMDQLRTGGMRPTPAGHPEEAFFRLNLRRSLQLHGRLAIAIALAALALAAIYVWRSLPIYTAESVLFIQPQSGDVVERGVPNGLFNNYVPAAYDSYIEQQIQNVSRQDVLVAAAQKLGPSGWKKAGESDLSAAERVRQAIEVGRVKTTFQVSITANAGNAAMAAQIANAVANSYIESLSTDKKRGDALRLAALRDERDRVQKELASDRTEQETLNAKMGQAAIGGNTPDHFDDQIGLVQAELVKARADHDAAAARFTSVGGESGPSSASLDAEADELIANDAGLVSMKTALNARRAVIISQMANLTPSHPQYKQDADELNKINQSLESMMTGLRSKAASRIQLKLRSDLERTAAIEGQLNAQLGQLTGTAGSATSKLQRAADLATDISRLQARFATVDEQWRNLMLDEDGAPGAAYVSTPAVPPLHSASSKVLRNGVIIFLGGIVLGLLAVVLTLKLDPKVYISADVEQVLGFPPMAQLPNFYEVPEGVAEEHLLRLSTAIEYARKQGNLKSCIFTGSGPGTGVTTVATRVREMLDAMGQATVLVDASGTLPPAPRANAAIEGEPGRALAVSHRPGRSSALVQQMAEETQTQEGTLVLTDTAPILVSAETEYLARFVDCAIVVVESGATTRAQLRDVAASLQRLDVSAVGFVLNRIGLQKADPAFRLSVKAIEDQLNAQSRSHARSTVRSQPAAAESRPRNRRITDKQPASKPIAQEPIENAPIRPPAQAPQVVPQVRQSPHTIHEELFVPTEPSLVPPQTSRTSPAPEPVLPQAKPDTDEPWWLADRAVQAVSNQTKPLLEPAIPVEPQVAASVEPVLANKFQSTILPLPAEPIEMKPVPAAPSPVIAEPAIDPIVPELTDLKPEPSPAVVPSPLAWERSAPVAPVIKLEAVPQPAREPEPELEPEAAPPDIASRFDGLRNLVTVLGLKQMHREGAKREPAPQFAPRIERAVEGVFYPRSSAPVPEPVSASVASGSPRLVIAQPEFLPPKPVQSASEAEGSVLKGTSNRRDGWTGDEELGILPSRRGQYKKG